MMNNTRIFVAGHKGMVGSALVRFLKKNKHYEIITIDKKYVDLTNQLEVQNFFEKQKIDQVYVAAAKVGGIYANNTFPADFIYQNIMIQTNIIHASFLNGIKKLLFLGSSCIYPKNSNQPMKEDYLLTGKLEPTNEPYAIAKIAGIKMCESYNRQYGLSHDIDYRSVMPTNLYGPGDNYHPQNSHVLPALIRRFHFAKIKKESTVTVWGTGSPKREFLYVDDMARACIQVMELEKSKFDQYSENSNSLINVGFGKDITIKELAVYIKEAVGYKGKIIFDKSKPDGTPRKLVDSNKIQEIGWKPKINLKGGLIKTYKDFLKIKK